MSRVYHLPRTVEHIARSCGICKERNNISTEASPYVQYSASSACPRKRLSCRVSRVVFWTGTDLFSRIYTVDDAQEAKLEASQYLNHTSQIPHYPRSGPNIGIVALVPIDEALPARNTRHGRPTATEDDIVLAIVKVGRVRWVQRHGLEAGCFCQRRGGPFLADG